MTEEALHVHNYNTGSYEVVAKDLPDYSMYLPRDTHSQSVYKGCRLAGLSPFDALTRAKSMLSLEIETEFNRLLSAI